MFLLKLVAPEMGDATSSRCLARVNGANSSIATQNQAPRRIQDRLSEGAPSKLITRVSCHFNVFGETNQGLARLR
jgi:hypothetical protein